MDLILSDIHADFKGLTNILDIVTSKDFIHKYGEFSRILCLGDILERGTQPKEVLSLLLEFSKQYDLQYVMGNHDEAFLYGRQITGSSLESIDAHNKLNEEDLAFFPKNNDNTFGKQQLIDRKNKLFCVHGGPLDPNKIMPKDGQNSWLYQKTWQRISEEDYEFFSYSGYHYKAISAFNEVKKYFNNFLIFCGHQHIEGLIQYEYNKTRNLLPHIQSETEKIAGRTLNKRELSINPEKSYIVRVGMAGPEGYYGKGLTKPHFCIADYDQKVIRLFSIC